MQTRSDDSIRSDVLFELKWDPKIGSSSEIAVAVKDGVVTLSGFVRSYWDKDAAGKAAKRVYGVRGVANEDFKLFINRAGIHQGPDGDYSLVVEPVEGEQQIFSEPEKANWALIEWMVKSAHANDRYFTLAEDG